MSASLSPALVLIIGAALVPFLAGRVRAAYMLALPIAGAAWLAALPDGEFGAFTYLGLELVPLRVDGWSRMFGYVFFLATFISTIYALHVREWSQHVAGLVYAGAALGAVFAGDFLTLFFYWELTAIASVFLIWARRTERAYRAGMRYLLMQLLSGMLLLGGAVAWYLQTGSLRFGTVGLADLAGWLIFIAFGIKCAFPLLHNWLPDAYPEATETGTVFLSAFTTKLAVYALARGFAGTESLVWIGAAMAAFPIFYAVIENDLRRVLAYSLNNQLGFMVLGIGVGTELALNGTAAHAFSSVLYKALLFMAMGAVLLRTGTVKSTGLGGLYKSMPWTTGFCIVGAASISSVPFFSGFVSKSLIITAAAGEGHFWAWLVLLFASAGVFLQFGIKIPYSAFFARDSGIRCQEAPWNMLVAMMLTAALCIGIGIFPGPLYALLPYPVDYAPYTGWHVLAQLQLLVFSALAFSVLMWTRIYPPELRSVNLDTDWVYRRLAPTVAAGATFAIEALNRALAGARDAGVARARGALASAFGTDGALGSVKTTSGMVVWVAVLLAAFLILYYF